MARFFLGVDGGQSSTKALVGEETGRVIGHGRGGPCNHVGGPEGREKFVRAVGDCVREACGRAGMEAARVDFEAACLGFSGGPADKRDLVAGMLRAGRLIVTHDALIALAGATAGEPGVIVIAGTGSIAFGRNAAGKSARAGGWGYLFGDEGGGFDITRQALRAALRFEEGWGPPTELRRLLLEAGRAADADELLHRFYTTEFPRPKIAALASLCDQAARNGDAVARAILEGAAERLATLAGAVCRQLFQAGEPARISYAGGVFHSGLLRERYRALMESEEGNQVEAPILRPSAGALLEAYAASGLRPALKGLPEAAKQDGVLGSEL